MIRIHGVPFSAHTRKVIITALEKGLEYALTPVLPLDPPMDWLERSPLGLIPAMEDGDVRLADSSVICQYLERRYPAHPFYPVAAADFGRALWIEEFVDSGLAPHVLRGLLLPKVFAPAFLGQAPDHALIARSVDELIPPRLAYLERTLGAEWFSGPRFGIGDVAVASILINYRFAGLGLDAQRYPRLQDFLCRALQRDSFRAAFEIERPAAQRVPGLDLGVLDTLGA